MAQVTAHHAVMFARNVPEAGLDPVASHILCGMKVRRSSVTGTPNAAAWVASYELARRGLELTLDGISDAEALVVPQPGAV